MKAASVKVYIVTYVALIALLALTLALSQLHLGVFAPFVALTIACGKMILIVLYFMHLRHASRLTWVFAAAGFFWLGILIVLAMADYLSRGR